MLWLFGFFLIVLLAAIAYLIYFYKNKNQYIRERFAFAALNAWMALIPILVMLLVPNFKDALFVSLLKTLGIEFQSAALGSGETTIILFALAGLLVITQYLYKNWDGEKSTAQYRREQVGQHCNVVIDSYLMVRHIAGIELLEKYTPEPEIARTPLTGAKADLTWREQAKDLVELACSDYRFEADDWKEAARCWIGTDRGRGSRVVLAVRRDVAEAKTQFAVLQDYVADVWRNHKWNEPVAYIVAVQAGDINDKHYQFGEQTAWVVSESALLDDLVDFRDYFRHIREQIGKPLQNTDLTLRDVYTVSRYRLAEEGKVYNNIEAMLDEWLAENTLRQLALLGEYGQGKTTLSWMLSYRLMQRVEANQSAVRIPIVLTLRGKSPRNLEPQELLGAWAGRFGIDGRALMKLLIAGRLLLIFEGFDEVELSGDKEKRIQHFQTLWDLSYPQAKILITGRPNFFLDNRELKQALGIQEPSSVHPFCEAVWLETFDLAQIEACLSEVDASVRKEIVDLARRDVKFREVVARPSMLHNVSVMWKPRNLAQYKDRMSSALVMDEFVRYTLERQAAKDKPVQYMQLNTPERAYFMTGVAVYMLVNELNNQITHQQLDQLVKLLADKMPEAISRQGIVSLGETRQPLRERLTHAREGYEAALNGIKTDVRSCGLLERDLASRGDSFKFGHKSFMEFLAGKVFGQWWARKDLETEDDKLLAESLINTLKLKSNMVLKQPETLGFAAEWVLHVQQHSDDDTKANVLFDFIFGVQNIVKQQWGRFLTYSLSARYCSGEKAVQKHFGWHTIVTAAIFLVVSVTSAAGDAVFAVIVIFVLVVTFIVVGIVSGVISIVFPATIILAVVLAVSVTNMIITGLSKFFLVSLTVLISILTVMVALAMGLFFGVLGGLLAGKNSRKIQQYASSAWMQFEHWHTACQSAKISDEAMEKVVGKGGLALIKEAKAEDKKV
ncbi:NACHT domain-containing protein [Candidatus Albibeggiatoa sp. nov. NOAA]|uniref:NACHT domain-containing protein n=1 Tax=Candidatus Albibeggiatoa sp. nov. NOAA TaxID=3162724 RepID=UPI0032F4F8E8|nr:NACHT domain-containing protein [Thiotrichaceae bacterium]